MGRTQSQSALAKASIKELRAKIHVAQERRNYFVRYLKELWQGAEKGKFSREFCLKTEYTKLEGKTIREWIIHYDNYIKECEALISKYQKDVARGHLLAIFISAIIISLLAFSFYQFQPSLTGFFVQEPVPRPEVVSEANATISTIQAQATLGQPVKWTKTISLDKPSNLTIILPEETENITVRKITESYSEQAGALQNQTSPFQEEPLPSEAEPILETKVEETSFKITGGVISTRAEEGFLTRFFRNIGRITGGVIGTEPERATAVEINDTATSYEIEYETPGPTAIEQEIERGKRIKISGPDTIHYENVLAFTNLPEKFNIKSPSSIKIHWIENDTFIQITNIQDTNNNGIYDYIEWIVPSLSEQTFEIIVVTKAEHLDSDRNFISDIYNEVKELDDVWSETIPDQDYIRVTFAVNLTSERDITLYPRVVSGNPKIEVYEKNRNELIAEFKSLNSNQYNKIFLDGSSGAGLPEGYGQDTFDLKVLYGSVEIDHIIDPTSSDFTYNVTTSLMLTDENNFMGTLQIRAMGYDSVNNLIFFGGNQTGSIPALYGFYNISNNQTKSLAVTDESNFIGTNDIRSRNLPYDSVNNITYIGGNSGVFGFYNISSNTTKSLMLTDESDFIGTSGISSLVRDSTNNLIYIGGAAGKFGFYNISSNTTKSLMLTDESNLMGTNLVQGLAYDSTNNLVYVGSVSGVFGFYNISDNTTKSLMLTDEGNFIGTNNIIDLSYDSTNKLVYVAGASGVFGFYNISSNTTKSLMLTDESDFIGTNGVQSLTYDSTNNLVYVGGASGVFGFYNISSNTTKSLMLTDESDFIGTNGVGQSAYSSSDRLIYVGGPLGIFGVYNPNRDPTSITLKYPDNNMNFTSLSITFSAIGVDPDDVSGLNVSIWGNWSGTWQINTSNASSLNNTQTNFSISGIPDGKYIWSASVKDTGGATLINTTNYTFTKDTVAPVITLPFYTNGTQKLNNETLTLNISVSDATTSPSACRIDANGTNTTISVSSGWCNTTSIPLTNLANGNRTINVYANDSTGQFGLNNSFVVDIISINAAPTIPFVQAVSAQAPLEAGTRNFVFNFSVNDTDGSSNINVSSVRAQFNRTGESTRSNTSCVNISSGGNGVMFTCTVGMLYFDENAVWTINVSARDNSEASAENSTTNLTYNLLTAMVISPTALTWGTIGLSDTDTGSNNDPILINNTGNAANMTINMTAYNLRGETTTTKFIFANNFTVGNATQGCTLGSGTTTMSNATSIQLNGTNFSKGNNSLNFENQTSGQEQLFVCLKGVPQDATAQSYSSSFYGAWEIRILLVALIPAGRRKKEGRKLKKSNRVLKLLVKLTDELREEYSEEKEMMIKQLIGAIIEEYNVTRKEVLSLIVKEVEIPVDIFSKELGALESLVKYMKENLNMGYREIAEKLGRDERTIWTAYKKATEKQKEPFKIKKSKIIISISALKRDKLTVLESLIIYLKEKGLKFSEIADVLDRDQRNIWTICSRAMKKLPKKDNNI